MKKRIALILLLFIPLLAAAQFEQKVSITLSAGGFSTIGSKTYMPEWGISSDDKEPYQISNFRPGLYTSLGLQFNLNRNFSLQADVGIMYSGNWFYNSYDNVNYTYFAVWDTITHELLTEGHNELSILNIGIGLTLKYYLLPGKKLNPFLFAGLTLNFTSTDFQDNEWQALSDVGYLDLNDSGPERANIEKNIGLGFNPGAGIEYNLNDKIGFYLKTGYYFVLLNKENFDGPEMVEHFHALTLQAGIKFSFAKSKDF